MSPTTRGKKEPSAHKRVSTAPAKQRGIGAFGKISKPAPHLTGKKHVLAQSSIPVVGHEEGSRIHKISLKRKLSVSDNCSDEEAATVSENPRHVISPNTPRKKRLSIATATETPTKGARTQFDSLVFSSSRPTSPVSPVALCDGNPPTTPLAHEHIPSLDSEELPIELQELISLHTAFLTATSLHFAHNGPMTPADLRILGPSVEQAWRKRKVTTENVRRILGLIPQDDDPHPSLQLSDYGQGKVCVELQASFSLKTDVRPIKQDHLVNRFAHVMRERWASYNLVHKQNTPVDAFISTLPLMPIMPCASLSKIRPLRAKGQQRLEDLKAGAIRAQQRPLSSTSASVSSSPLPKKKMTARSSDLFSRVHAKQLHQATLPLPVSPEIIAHNAALQRLPEIAPVLGNLVLSSQKHRNDDAEANTCNTRTRHVSFTMPTLTQHLQMSLKNPIAKDQAIGCIRLLAEVAPEWVGIREVGKLIGVTVKGSAFGREVLAERMRSMSEKVGHWQTPLRT